MSRVGAYVLDQGLSSASNFATLFLAATLVDSADFGAFTLSASLFGLALGVARATSSERIAARGTPHVDAQPILTGSVALLALASVGLASLLGLLTGNALATVWAAAGPATLVQDRLRFVALRHRPRAAAYSDGVWLCSTCLAWVLCRRFELEPLPAMALLAVSGPLLGLGLLAVMIRPEIEFELSNDLRSTVSEARFVADSWLQAAAVFVSLALVAGFLTLADAGRCRALMLMFQPFVSLAYAGRIHILNDRDPRRVRRWPRRLGSAAFVYGAVAGCALTGVRAVTSVPEVWTFGVMSFVFMWIAQTARAYHQGIVDVSRRGVGRGIVGPRVLFGFLLVGSTLVAVPAVGFVGFSVAFVLAYSGAAIAAHANTIERGSTRELGSVR